MTILPKKKKGEQESDSDSEHSNSNVPAASHGVPAHAHGHSSHGSPRTSEDGHHHSPTEGYYHRRYDLSGSSSDESSPELSSLGKRPSYRTPSSTGPGASARGKKTSDSSPYLSGYNSAEEYEGPRRTYTDPEKEVRLEQALKKERGFIIKKMRADGACLFRAVADQVYGDQEMHTVVRNHCMDYMMKSAEYFSQFVTEDFDHYINRKRSDQCYGNNLEMQAIAEMYNRIIEVYEYSTEPINVFFGVYKTDNAPIRLSYHGGVHYNSVVDPYKATIGVGLGLAEHKPGFADKSLMSEALRKSERNHLEQTMLHDKLRSTDWEASYEAIEEAVARESYLSWLREREQRALASKQGSQSTSSACGSSPPTLHAPLPPPMSTTSTSTSTLPLPTSHIPTTVAAALTTTSSNLRGKPITEMKTGGSRNGSPGSRRGSHRNTPSPPGCVSYRGSPGGSHHGSVRNSPYVSPHTSPRSSLRGSPRNSLHGSPRNGSPTHGSPQNSPHGSPPLSLLGARDVHTGTHSPVTGHSPPPVGKPLLVATSEASPRQGGTPPITIGSPNKHFLEAPFIPSTQYSPPSQSPTHSLDFESGRVLSQLPYEYSSFLDLPPSAFGLSEWEDDRILAAVLAASQQEYIDSLRQNARGAESL